MLRFWFIGWSGGIVRDMSIDLIHYCPQSPQFQQKATTLTINWIVTSKGRVPSQYWALQNMQQCSWWSLWWFVHNLLVLGTWNSFCKLAKGHSVAYESWKLCFITWSDVSDMLHPASRQEHQLDNAFYQDDSKKKQSRWQVRNTHTPCVGMITSKTGIHRGGLLGGRYGMSVSFQGKPYSVKLEKSTSSAWYGGWMDDTILKSAISSHGEVQ